MSNTFRLIFQPQLLETHSGKILNSTQILKQSTWLRVLSTISLKKPLMHFSNQSETLQLQVQN